MKTIILFGIMTVTMVSASALAQQSSPPQPSTQPVTQTESTAKSTASRLRDLIKEFEDDPVQSTVDRDQLLAEVSSIVERFRQTPTQSAEKVMKSFGATEDKNRQTPTRVEVNKPVVSGEKSPTTKGMENGSLQPAKKSSAPGPGQAASDRSHSTSNKSANETGPADAAETIASRVANLELQFRELAKKVAMLQSSDRNP